MDNNNNTNNASHATIPPLRPDPPDPPGQAPATTTKSYSAAVGARSAAKHGNATANASTAVAAHPLMHNIENCVIINTPPSTLVEQVLLALDKYYPGLTGAMPCVIKGQRGLRFPKAADLDTLVANGLTVGKTLCKVEKLYSSTRGGVVQCTLTGFFSDPEGLCLFDEQIAAYGTVLRRRIQYIGKTKHISGVYDFILALKDVDVLPPASLSIARDGVTERIPLRITGGMRHCVFCRSAAHVHKDCPVAPACKSCASTSHATQHCPARHASSPQGPPTSRAPQASTVTTAAPAAPAAVSKSISPASAHDRTTKKRRVEQDLAAQTEDLSNRAQPDSLSKNARPEFSFNFNPWKIATPPAPQPASNQGIAYSLVEKSSKSPSSETTSPSPSPPPATPKSIITQSKSIAALSKPATREAPPTAPALEASEPSPEPSSPTPLPSAAPKARPDDADTDDEADEEADDQEAPPKDSINEDRKRASLFSNLRSHNADVFLLSKTGRPSPKRVAQWTQECQDLKLSALFTPFNNTAILWKSDSMVITFDPESPPNTLRASFSFPDRVTDATFCVGDPKVRVVSIYAPSSDKPDKKRFLSHLSTALRQVVRDEPLPPALLVGGDWNCVESQPLDSENQNGTNYGGQEMRDLATANNLFDAYRLHHPKGRATTNCSAPGTCRRLDRIYVSPDWVDLFHDHKIWAPVLKSTHSMVVARFQVPGAIDIGPGKFKLGLHVIEGDATCEYLTSIVRTLYNKALLQTPNDPPAAWTSTKHRLLPELQALARTFARFRRGGSEQERADHSRYGAALRSRLDPSLAGPSSIFIRLRKVRASDLIPSLTVNDVVHSDPDSMLGAASDYFERVYEDRPIDDAALKAIIDGLASTRLSPADSLKLEEAYPLEEMTKAQAACKSNSSPGPDGLPVEFYCATWPATGSILRDVINSIPTEARQPGPLPRNTAHIHLIHERGERDQLSNKRPILLINADERIISQAHNQRLAPLLESLIGPTQRGFVPNRWIGTNIAEVQCLMDPGLPGSTPVSGMLAVMDFEKAYDRLSHPYLDAVLCAVGLGPKARQWYRATYTNQSASIFLNGWLSATFDILSGVRQGDPLAPSLFVLAIEGFACQIRLRVKGIDIAGLQNVRELLFADDACCALHNLSDLDHLNRAIELYERASASKLSIVKSFLYPLGAFRNRSIAPDLGTWRLSDSQFRNLGIQIGVEIAEDAGWEDVKAPTIARIRSVPMYDLPYAAKCSIINIYCYTKILYYSRFLPAPKSVVKEIEEAAMLAIHGRASDGTQRRPKVSRSRLCTPLDHGGFGLIDLPRRLAIDHAKRVFQLRAPDGCFTRHLFDIRIRLQAPNEPTPFTLSRPAPNQHRCPWIWIWWAYFCHPPPKWDHAVRKTTKLLPARWVRYFEAWALVTTLNPPELSKSQNLEQWAMHVLYFPAGHGIQLSVNPTLFRGPNGEVMTSSSFVNASKRHQVFIFPPIFPKGHQKVFDLPEQRWNAWWKALRKVRRVHSDAEDTGHLLSLGSLHPGSQVASPTSPHPNNRYTSCVMCLSEAPECLVHLAVGCPFARRLWSALSPTPHPVFVDFVCPVVSRSERRLVELRVLFFHSIWKLCRRRRFSSDLLEPITETEFEGL
ncbi:BQ5605_C006g03749 [Microbotryum silenes-dioicae]|uniref:BQ5605_C006g03749 protein n=1 Tax=Microbotryum silenes-dioicae TaxID=796604 RepID=A0A2X0M4X9_9BASI|nr:BQ5605_C006g03749 [Microbotryum silenes-dioicae]